MICLRRMAILIRNLPLEDSDERDNLVSDTVAEKSWLATSLPFGCAKRATSHSPIAVGCAYLLARSGSTIAHTTLSPTATTDFEKSHILAMAPALRAGTTMVSPAEHFFISSEAFASLSKKATDTGRQ